MTADFTGIAETLKDKIGRKQIISLATIACLTYLIATDKKELLPLIVVGLVGIVAILAQLAIDWKYPRANGNNKTSEQLGAVK